MDSKLRAIAIRLDFIKPSSAGWRPLAEHRIARFNVIRKTGLSRALHARDGERTGRTQADGAHEDLTGVSRFVPFLSKSRVKSRGDGCRATLTAVDSGMGTVCCAQQ